MNPKNMLSKLFLPALLVVAVSCNSGDDKKDAKTDTTAVKAPVPAPPKDIMTIKHKVANFAKWKAGYDAHDSARLAAGLHNYVIARGIEDSNLVLIGVHYDDIAKAKAFAADPNLKEVMQKAGVTGAPEIEYRHQVYSDTANITQPARVMIKHKVKDWDAWKKAFDEHKQARMDNGLVDRVISYDVADNHMVTIVFAITDMAKVKAFMKSKDLADKMKAGGVEGPPSIFFYNVVQHY